MGEPATPTAQQRAETRRFSAAVVQSVIDDAVMPLGLDVIRALGDVVRRSDVEDLVFSICQEVVALHRELAALVGCPICGTLKQPPCRHTFEVKP